MPSRPRQPYVPVGGEEDDVEAARPVLDALVGTVQETGGSGSAQLARAAYTLQTSAQIMSAIEADALYRAVQRSSAAFGATFGRAGATTPEAEQVLAAVNAGHFDGAYTVEMLMSELSAALMAADDVDLILPQAEACLHLLEAFGRDRRRRQGALGTGPRVRRGGGLRRKRLGLDARRAGLRLRGGGEDCDYDDDGGDGDGGDFSRWLRSVFGELSLAVLTSDGTGRRYGPPSYPISAPSRLRLARSTCGRDTG